MDKGDLEKIPNGDYEPLIAFYKKYRNDFIRWAIRNYSCSEEEAKDVFQEVMISFFQNIRSGQIHTLSSGIKTYLWAIGKNHLLNRLKKNKRLVTFTSFKDIKLSDQINDEMAKKEEQQHNHELVRKYLSLLGEKEQKILRLYYIEQLPMSVIAEKMGYKNADVAKKKKYEVMKKLARIIAQKIRILVLI